MSVYPGKQAANGETVLQMLQRVKVGGANRTRMKTRDMIFILRNISILVENGLSLPKSLDTLVNEVSLKKYAPILCQIKQRLESGETFSSALGQYPDVFREIMVSQVRVGEKSGTIPQTLSRIVRQLERAENLKGMIIKRLTYPALLVTAGSSAVTFMLLYVVPTFEGVYAESGAKLPAVTQLLIDFGHFMTSYGWLALPGVVGLLGVIASLRRNPTGRLWMDAQLLHIPAFGTWFKNLAVLQLMEVLGNLLDAGFTVVEAVRVCTSSVENREVRRRVQSMHEALLRGEKFSSELQRHRDLFPPVVSQLVVVGEQTGTLNKTTLHIRDHLRREVEVFTSLMVGMIEPVATVVLAVAIGTILLAIYLPMFDMINAMSGGGH